MKMKKSKGTRILVVLWLIVFAVIGFELVFRDEVKFITMDFLSRISTSEINKVEAADNIATKTMSLDEFLTCENVTVNESMLLVNTEYILNENYSPQTVYHEERDVTMNSCVKNSFNELSEALFYETGETLYISSALRTAEEQKSIKEEEGDMAQEPGCSEHQTGLALDVFVQNFAGEGFIKCQSGQFVNEFCGDYGFIIRYPIFGEKLTGISYEPWHLRYVGYPHSKIINESYITFEKYIESFDIGAFYTYENYIITRQSTENIIVPPEFESAVISEDNTGALFITFAL